MNNLAPEVNDSHQKVGMRCDAFIVLFGHCLFVPIVRFAVYIGPQVKANKKQKTHLLLQHEPQWIKHGEHLANL